MVHGVPGPNVSRFVFVSDLPPGASADSDDERQRIGWRLIAANNRPLARSVRLWPTFAECFDTARTVHLRSAELDTAVQFDGARGLWTWHARLDGEPQAVTAHGSLRRIQCLRAVDQFIVAVRDNPPLAHRPRQFGEHALRVHDSWITS